MEQKNHAGETPPILEEEDRYLDHIEEMMSGERERYPSDSVEMREIEQLESEAGHGIGE